MEDYQKRLQTLLDEIEVNKKTLDKQIIKLDRQMFGSFIILIIILFIAYNLN